MISINCPLASSFSLAAMDKEKPKPLSHALTNPMVTLTLHLKRK